MLPKRLKVKALASLLMRLQLKYLVKRQRKPGILTKSPYLDGRQPIQESTSSFRFEACAFDIGLVQPLIEDVRSFDEWFHDGYRPDNIKMATFNKKISKKVTTTDSFFGSMVRRIYPAVVENSNVLARQVSLLEYPLGEYMHCNTPWTEVDHVLMPIRMGVHAHWILVHLDIRNRCLNAYN
ncbi:Ulp1 protease family [Abeliophyllum distichum]|uniref:Ulp1 protease family n=1 Tax=Abeliophyllum distichum TaxID=126358 RepID=A0ABD1PQL1_9LAMI